MRVLALDIGGTKIAAAVVDQAGNLAYLRRCPTQAHLGGQAVLARVVDLAQQVLAEVGLSGEALPVAVGVGTGGQVDPVSGQIMSATDVLPGWAGMPLKLSLEEALGLPVAVDNDVNATGLGEAIYGAGRGCKHLLVIAVGTGIGGAVILDGVLHHGLNGLAGHVGHVSIDALNGRRCTCGSVGCVEMYASGPAIEATWRETVETAKNASWLEKPLAQVRVSDIVTLLSAPGRARDHAWRVLYEAGRYLGYAVASLLHVLDPERVVIGGGVAQVGEVFFAGVREAVQERAMVAVKHALIVPAELGADAALVGAAELAWRGL